MDSTNITSNNLNSTQQSIDFKIYELTFYHPKLIAKTIQVRPTSFLYQFRSIISDGSMLKLFENYQFVHNKVVLAQMTPLEELLPSSQSKEKKVKFTIDIRLVAYDERSAKYHLRQFFEMINNPILYQLYQIFKSEENKQIFEQIKNRTTNLQSTVLMNENIKISSDINEVLDYNVANELLLSFYKIKKPELIQFISLSGFNPPPPQQRLDGNLFYIHLRALESIDYHITASPEGFFLNQSKISSFNPLPVPNKPAYASLFDLVKSLSQKFEDNLQNFLAENKLDDNDKFLLFFKANNFNKWYEKVEHEHTWNSKKSMNFYIKESTNLQFEDWNESFHIADKPPIQNADSFQIFDTRHKLYKNFEEAAVEGATMLIDGKISPLNPLEEKKKQIYIYNKIFFSIAHETPYNHSQQKGEQAAPSSSAINTDLINLEVLYNLQIPNLNVLHMILINYRGYKIIAQCIIPGILSAEQNLCSQYGSIDDGKTIETNPEFEKLMVQVAEKLHLQENITVHDANNVQKKIAISPDIKGILGSNQKKYILDLLRLSPRDLNYPQIENETCVLRHELVESFKKYKADKKQQIPKINTNIGTEIKFIENDKTQPQKQSLKQMAKYLIDIIIPKVINSLKTNGSSYLTNSQGISQTFHQHGLNMRYLGRVHAHQQLKSQSHIKIFLQRIILTKCLKHLFRMIMRETNIMHMNLTLTRVLNCLFGQISHIQQLQQGNIKQAQQDLPNKQGKKKKKKNKTKDQISLNQNSQTLPDPSQNLIKIPPPLYLTMKPSELWDIIRKLAKARYNFDIKQTLIEYNTSGIFLFPYTKLATLQDLSFSIGMTLQQRSYNIVNQGNLANSKQNSTNLPFHYKNIVNLSPISKHMRVSMEQQAKLVEIAQDATQKYRVKQAMDCYNTLLQLYSSMGDVQKICQVYSKLGKILYTMAQYQIAVVRQISSLKIYQMGLRQMNYKVVQSYSKLGLYQMVIGNRNRALYFLHKSLMLMLINYGETYPDILVTLANIARIYQQDKQSKFSINCYLKGIELLQPVTGKDHINISFCYSSLASLHYDMKDLKKAIEYQAQSVGILSEILPENDSRLGDAKKILKVYHDLALKGSVYLPQQVPGTKIQTKDKSKK